MWVGNCEDHIINEDFYFGGFTYKKWPWWNTKSLLNQILGWVFQNQPLCITCGYYYIVIIKIGKHGYYLRNK
jgi:hypothetical protein